MWGTHETSYTAPMWALRGVVLSLGRGMRDNVGAWVLGFSGNNPFGLISRPDSISPAFLFLES
jgi:hypothetical protein